MYERSVEWNTLNPTATLHATNLSHIMLLLLDLGVLHFTPNPRFTELLRMFNGESEDENLAHVHATSHQLFTFKIFLKM